jgi:hypothetical protein
MSPRDLVAESFGKYGDTIQALRVVLAEFPDALVWYTFPQTRPNMWCSSGRDLYAKLASRVRELREYAPRRPCRVALDHW